MEKVIKDLQTNTGDLENLKSITCVVQVKIFMPFFMKLLFF